MQQRRWNYEFVHRPTPDYFQSFGLGFFEYFQLCEDIGAQPLPILNCGMACQFNSGELCTPEALGTYIQDALDLIEFANGPAGSTWGAKRAAMGHPAPFNMRLLGIGNEQWGEQYFERYEKFTRVLKEKHPEISLVSAAGPDPSDERFRAAWKRLRGLHADIVDEHCYDKPDWFFSNTHRYDAYDRSGPKVFMGEYAAQSVKTVSTKNRNTLECALAEAAYLTGLERNADVVRMASYAPLFANTEAWQWTPDLVWVDSLHLVRTPSYHVQSLFAQNRGDRVLPAEIKGASVPEQSRLYACATADAAAGDVIVKLVNATSLVSRTTVELTGAVPAAGARWTQLSSGDLNDENTFESPERVSPKDSIVALTGSTLSVDLPANSFSVIRIGVGK
jgi:alpha-L-arabinofuranosidase